jgi:hypothetical protein
MLPESPLDIQPLSSSNIFRGREILSVDQQARLDRYFSSLQDPTERQNQLAKIELAIKELTTDFGTDKESIQQEFNATLEVCEKIMKVEQKEVVIEQKEVVIEQKEVVVEQKEVVVEQKEVVVEHKEVVDMETIVEKGQVKTEVGQVKTEVGQVKTETVESKVSAVESLILAGKALDSKIASVTGKPTKELIPDYDTALSTARATLASQGLDERLAEGFVMLQHQDKILSHIPPANRADLRREFASLRDGLGNQGLPIRTPASVALSDPRVTVESYTKIQQGFGTTPPLIHASNGEIRTSRELVSGKSTIMTIHGERFRESRGIRIESPVPNTGAIEDTQIRLNNAQATARMREPQVNAIARITLSEIRELATRDIREDGVTGEAQKNRLAALTRATDELSVNPADPESATTLRGKLTQFFTSETFKSLPDADRRQVSDRLRIYFESIQNQANLHREIAALKSENPAALIQSKIAHQDAVIDRNLSDINRIGLHHLGQDGYDRTISALSTVFKQQSLGEIDDTKPFDGRTTAALEATLLSLIGQTREQAYPDGTLSTQAIAKIQGLGAVSNERLNEAVRQAVHADQKTQSS